MQSNTEVARCISKGYGVPLMLKDWGESIRLRAEIGVVQKSDFKRGANEIYRV
jgi:hypothetical protein